MPVTEHTRTAIAHANPARSHGHGCTRVCAVRHGGYGAAAPRTDLRGAWPTCALFFFCSLFSPPSFAFVFFSLFFVSSNSLLKKKNPGMFGRVCRPRARLPRATDGGNKDDSAHYWEASGALWRAHCKAGIGHIGRFLM